MERGAERHAIPGIYFFSYRNMDVKWGGVSLFQVQGRHEGIVFQVEKKMQLMANEQTKKKQQKLGTGVV